MDRSSLIKNYIPELDGLRAIAVLAVMVFHIAPLSLPGGFLGVDIFFVLSGYLITSLLMLEHSTHGSFSLRNFYLRRALRLAPALGFLLLIFLLASYCFPQIFGAFSLRLKEAALSALYISNWARAFDFYPQGPFLAHTWSLAIEEQFYILWPLLLMVLLACSSGERRKIAAAIAVIIILICVWRVMLIANGATIDRVYNGLDTRGDALMWGALVALLPLRERIVSWRPSYSLAFFSMLMLLLIYLLHSSSWEAKEHYVWKLPLIYGALAGLIALAASQRLPWWGNILRNPLMVFTGRISYGLYLWHMPILIVLLKNGFSDGKLLLLVITASYVFAAFSWFVIERPALRLRVRYQR